MANTHDKHRADYIAAGRRIVEDIERPRRVGDPVFSPLDAIDVLINTRPVNEAGAVTIPDEDLRTIRDFLARARIQHSETERAYREAIAQRDSAQLYAAALLRDKQELAEASEVETVPGPGGSRVLVGKETRLPDLAKPERGVERLEQSILKVADEHAGRLVELEASKVIMSRQLRTLNSGLEEAEKTLSAQGQELLTLNQRLYVDETGNRIGRLEKAVAELQRRPGPIPPRPAPDLFAA